MSNIPNKLKIFVSAYACEPNLGSEIGVGWHWVLEMSKYFELWVLTRKSNKVSIEEWMKENPVYSNINFIYFDLPYYLRFWKKGMRGVRTYYNIWQWTSNSVVKKTMQEHNIDIYHHLTYGNTLWPVSSYGQKQFFIWGPTGGVDTIPSEFSNHYAIKGRLIEWLRRIVVNNLKYNYGFNKRCENADLILCKTDILRNIIPSKFRDKAILFTDVAVEKLTFDTVEKTDHKEAVKFITVGKLDAWRGFDLLIEAFDLAIRKNPNIHLQIVGKGQDRDRLQKLIQKKELSKYIEMTGSVSMEEYYKLMRDSDVVLNASLKEGAVTVSFDSMAMGKPLICIDTTGYTRYFSNAYAIVIPQQNRNETIHALEEAILNLTSPSERAHLGNNAKIESEKFTWNSRGIEIYTTINNWYQNKQGNLI